MTDYYDAFMLSAGQDFIKINTTKTPYKYENKLENTLHNDLVDAWSQIIKLYINNHIGKHNLEQIYKFDTFALYIGNLYSACKDSGAFNTQRYNCIGAVPVAGPSQSSTYIPVIPRTYGIPKRAKQPELGIMFIRYLLGFTRTYSSESMGFCNDYLLAVGSRILTISSSKYKIPNIGAIDYLKKGKYENLCNKLVTAENQNITSVLKSNIRTIDASIDKINEAFKSTKFN